MLDRFTEALTGRRLGGALLVLGGLIVAYVVLFGGGDGKGPDSPAKAKVESVRLVSVPQLGLAFAHPRTWTRTVSGHVIRLTSPDDSSVMTFSSPLDGRREDDVKGALEQGLRKRYAPAKIVRDGEGKLGKRKVKSFELQGTEPGGKDRIRALALIGSSAYRTYAITLLTPARPSAERLAQVQQILATVRFSKPTRPPE